MNTNEYKHSQPQGLRGGGQPAPRVEGGGPPVPRGGAHQPKGGGGGEEPLRVLQIFMKLCI